MEKMDEGTIEGGSESRDLTPRRGASTYHSRSLYMMVKKTWRNRLTAFISTAKRYNHASPDMMMGCCQRTGRMNEFISADRR